jgi:hypothetical protein
MTKWNVMFSRFFMVIGKATFTLFKNPSIINFATFITAIASLGTIIEMRNSRISSEKPDIILENCNQNGFMNIQFNFKDNKSSWKLTNEQYNIQTGKYDTLPFSAFRFYNVGLGVARNVKVSYQFDLEKFIKYLSTIKGNDSIRFVLGKNNEDLAIYGNSSLSSLIVLYGNPLGSDDNVFQIVPYSSNTTPLIKQIPHLYFDLIRFSFLLEHKYCWKTEIVKVDSLNCCDTFKTKKLINDIFKADYFPPLFIIIKYDDISKRHYLKKFKATFQVLMSQENLENNSAQTDVELIIREMN